MARHYQVKAARRMQLQQLRWLMHIGSEVSDQEQAKNTEWDPARLMRMIERAGPVMSWAWLSMLLGSVIAECALAGFDMNAAWVNWVSGAEVAAEVVATFFLIRWWMACRR